MINNNILLDICNISIEAGLITNKYYKQKNKIINKEDNSPLTRADIDSNDFIIKSYAANKLFVIMSYHYNIYIVYKILQICAI